MRCICSSLIAMQQTKQASCVSMLRMQFNCNAVFVFISGTEILSLTRLGGEVNVQSCTCREDHISFLWPYYIIRKLQLQGKRLVCLHNCCDVHCKSVSRSHYPTRGIFLQQILFISYLIIDK